MLCLLEIPMTDVGKQLERTHTLSAKVAQLFQRRAQGAQTRYSERVQKVLGEQIASATQQSTSPWDWWSDWYRYSVDFAQRSVLFWDTLRQRGNQFTEREQAGLPPVLHFDYEMVLDARRFERPVNYALVRIVPPEGVTVDPKRRPYIIIDPRAGHGPGIGGFKDDSQVGEALRAGHPVYFVIFFPEPEPDQTMLDVCAAEQKFVRRVRELHPESPKPAIVGNCQGGWAAMMLASSSPEDTGPIVINGAPMSYWGGAWSEGEGDNPMRYAGGMLGGTWLASLAADLGNGKFDGAYLVQNFENLNPANTYFKKSYNVFANVDTEAPRFLDFERWWGGFYLMNREEIEWITQNLFVGNKLWSGETKSKAGKAFDLREIRSPIILFASLGDNITPPQQAFNWVADVYGSTEEIKSRGQVIVGLMHADVGHLGIFVSGKIAKREHRQIVSVLKSIEALTPGLYAMRIIEHRGQGGEVEYDVEFEERRLEEVAERLNRFKRADEGPFEAVEAVSDFNQRAYELFARPLVQATANEYTAKLGREFHPLRFEKWSISDRNPMLWWLGPLAQAVKAQRQAVGPDERLRKAEAASGEVVAATLDYYRDLRDATSEALFFQTYGNLFALYVAERAERGTEQAPADPRELPFVKAALGAIGEGGYPEALARAGELLARRGMAVPLSRLELKAELVKEYSDLLPDLPIHEWKRIRGEQDAIVRFEPERALETLPRLLGDPSDREKFLQVLERLTSDPRVRADQATPEQIAMVARIRQGLGAAAPRLAAAGGG
jgi:pimeloyl-ACP methyl ester carboxylesterase